MEQLHISELSRISINDDDASFPFDYCNQNNIYTVGLLGFDGGELNKKVNHSNLIQTEPDKYELVENMHLIICHLISSYLK